MARGMMAALRQYIGDALPGGALNPEVTPQGMMDTAAIAMTPVPIAGDLMGLMADVNRYRTNPEERTLGNYGLTAAGLLPFVPGKFYSPSKLIGDLTKTDKTDLVTINRNTKKSLEERRGFMRDFLKQPTEKWTPREYAFDRSSIKDALQGHPEVQQTKFQRVQPPRADLSYVDEVYTDPVNRGLIKDQIARGLPLGGETFYASLRPVYLEGAARGVPRSEIDKWVQGVAPASARNTIYNEMSAGNLLYRMYKDGVPLTPENVDKYTKAFAGKHGMGVPLMPVHRQLSSRVLEEGRGLMDQLTADYKRLGDVPAYKIPTYGVQKSGNFRHSWVGDVHEAAGETMGSRYFPYFAKQGGFTNNEYARAEPHMLKIADEMGLAGGQAQAGRWFGGGPLTGLGSPKGDALDLMERQAAYSLAAQGRKVTPQSVRDYVFETIQQGGDWLPWYRRNTDMPDLRFK